MTHDRYFYDTCSLLLAGESILSEEQDILISSITLKELERIKTSSNKDLEVKYQARTLLHVLDENPEYYEVVIHKQEYEQVITEKSLDINDDMRILSDAVWANRHDDIVFVTNDLSLKNIANLFFGDGMIDSVTEDVDDYKGYTDVALSEKTLEVFYQDPQNYFNLELGQYLILRDENDDIIDIRAWSEDGYRYINADPFKSKWFGKITPKDALQKCAVDSFKNNQLTYIGGPAGSGKSLLSLAYLFSELEKNRIDQIVIFCNPVVARNAAKLGYYPGTCLEKILSTQAGNILASKLGDMSEVERLVAERKLVIVPAGDARGYQTLPHSGVYIMEAQNYDVVLLRMLLQRIDDTSIVICDGDKQEQTDLQIYSGANNGLRKMSQVFKGQPFYGQVELNTIYRSKIASVAENMR